MELSMTYRAVHQRIRARLGKASAHTCTCGDPATQWSYNHLDPNELVGENNGKSVRFSASVEFYEALCDSCHRRRDRPLGDTCPRGHARTPENTYHPPGKRSRQTQCRVCVREDSLASYHRRRSRA